MKTAHGAALITLNDHLTAWSHTHYSVMNELPVIGSLCLRKDLWDCHGANIATRNKGMYGKGLFRYPKKKTILGRDHRFFSAVLKEMGVVILIQG